MIYIFFTSLTPIFFTSENNRKLLCSWKERNPRWKREEWKAGVCGKRWNRKTENKKADAALAAAGAHKIRSEDVQQRASEGKRAALQLGE
ncbi:hypothetical protein ACFX2B_006783 [Malus domestica]